MGGDRHPKPGDVPMPSRLLDQYMIQVPGADCPNNPEEGQHMVGGGRARPAKFRMPARSVRDKIKAKVSSITCVETVEQVLARTCPVQQPYLRKVLVGRQRVLTGMAAKNRASPEPVHEEAISDRSSSDSATTSMRMDKRSAPFDLQNGLRVLGQPVYHENFCFFLFCI